MSRSQRFGALIFAALTIGSGAFAQIQAPGRYFERIGIQEFSGEMIVRPVQPSELTRHGINPFAQAALQIRARQRLQAVTQEYVPETDEFVVTLPPNTDENRYSSELMKTGDYQYVVPNWICYPVRNPNDPQFPQQWHHQKVKSPQAWDLVTGRSTQIVAVVDTGIDLTHPDLQANRVPGFNSVDRKAEIDGGQVNDLNGHGTHVAGDAAAIGNNATGVAGMGWNFKIMMIRTSNSPGGGATIDDILAGARWAVDHGAKSVSASYSGVDAAPIGTTGTYIKSKGALFCYAAGNDNRNLSGFFYPDTIVVGASDESDGKAGFSAYGRAVHVFAPGTNILSTTLGGGYGPASGTSMATPVCNGAIAMIFAANPGLTAQQAQDVLESQCDVIGPSAIFGHGRINQYKNVQRALSLLAQNTPPNSIVTSYGTYSSGTLANILAPNTGGPSYNVISSLSVPLGQVAGVTTTYIVPAQPNKLLSLSLTFQVKEVPQTLVTGFLYAWNYQTNAFENVGQFPVPSLTFAMQSKSLTGSLARFVGPGGVVKALYRSVSTSGGNNMLPFPYTLNIGYTKLTYAALP